MVLGYELLALYKSETGTLRKDIDGMLNSLMAKVEDVQNEVDPQIYADYKHLKGDMKEQKDENEQLYKTLLKMKTETAIQREKVEFCRGAVEQMEEHVGMIANNPNYKLEELEKLYSSSPTTAGVPLAG